MGARDRWVHVIARVRSYAQRCSARRDRKKATGSIGAAFASVPNSKGSRSNASARQHWRSFCTAQTALIFLQNSLACRKDQQTVAPRVVRVHHLQATRHRHDWGHIPRRQTILSARCSTRRLNKSPPPRILNRRPVPLFRTCRVRIRHRHAARFCTL